jgi:sodium-dependent dicarboxylate transporter 2/3/5
MMCGSDRESSAGHELGLLVSTMSGRYWSTIGGVVVAALVFGGLQHAGATTPQCWTAATAALCAVWWICETLPLAATSLLPLVIFPLAGVLEEKKVAAAYGDTVILLFLGGFMMSQAVERWHAHRRIAQMVMTIVGSGSGKRVVFAIMLATTLISMWINNTSTCLMMLPVALAIADSDKSGKLGVPLLLGVAYCSSIGGIATPIGTAPNGVFMSAYREATGLTIPFFRWMVLAVPISLVMMIACWLLLTIRLGNTLSIHLAKSEKWTQPQIRVLSVFGLAALAWITREVPFGGWSRLVGLPRESGDMIVAVTAAIAMFLIPSGDKKQGSRLLDWKTAESIPWGILILFGGGIAIARAFESSGLSEVIGDLAHGLGGWHSLAIIATLCFASTFLSEFTSNTATANILMPILAATAKANDMSPLLLMIPATLSNSLAFMMPVGTPPNAIAYGTGHVKIRDMVRYGFILNVVGAIITTLICWQLLPVVFEISG